MKKGMIAGMIFSCPMFLKGQAQPTMPYYIAALPSAWEPPAGHTHRWTQEFRNVRNELDFVFTGLFVMYKYVFSSQDLSSCVFSPSCSVYGLHSVRKLGPVRGILNTFDRLTRCHPQKPGKHYPVDPKTGRLYDPI